MPSKTQESQQSSEADEEDDYYEDDEPSGRIKALTLLARAVHSRVIASSARRTTNRSKLKTFFDTLVNAPSPKSSPESSTSRIIYVRDFSMLAASSSAWYPALLAAVRQRRQKSSSRPSGPITSPVTIIFGMTPSITSPMTTGSVGNFMSYLISSDSDAPSTSQSPGSEKADWLESEAAQKAREKMLQERLKTWESNELELELFLPMLGNPAEEDGLGDMMRPEVVILGPGSSVSPFTGTPDGRGARIGEPEKRTSFFRTGVLVPGKRSHLKERETRMARRREINELAMRMGVGLVGGRIEDVSASEHFKVSAASEPSVSEDVPPATEMLSTHETSSDPLPIAGAAEASEAAPREPSPAPAPKMWDEWGSRIEVWSNVKKIADSAVARAFLRSTYAAPTDSPLVSTVVPWDSVESAWVSQKALKDQKKNWLKQACTAPVEEEEGLAEETTKDEIVERVKQDEDLDSYEQRLLGCIVDAGAFLTLQFST